MNTLERLMQDEDGYIERKDGTAVSEMELIRMGQLKTIVVQNPCADIGEVLNKMAERNSSLIPNYANAYVASDFDGDTQHVRRDSETGSKKMYSVYAVQFYEFSKTQQ